MQIIRTALFYFSFFILTAILSIFTYCLCFKGKDFIVNMAKKWANSTLFLLKYICRLEVEVEKQFDLQKQCIVASKHQSALETIFLVLLIPNFCYILKKELTYIPIFGSLLKKAKMIYIKRDDGFKAVKNMVAQAKERADKDLANIIIFPEGTRSNYGQETKKYKRGVVLLAKALRAPIVPVALNTGKFWSKNSWVIKPGKAKIKFLPTIETVEHENLDENIRSTIEEACKTM